MTRYRTIETEAFKTLLEQCNDEYKIWLKRIDGLKHLYKDGEYIKVLVQLQEMYRSLVMSGYIDMENKYQFILDMQIPMASHSKTDDIYAQGGAFIKSHAKNIKLFMHTEEDKLALNKAHKGEDVNIDKIISIDIHKKANIPYISEYKDFDKYLSNLQAEDFIPETDLSVIEHTPFKFVELCRSLGVEIFNNTINKKELIKFNEKQEIYEDNIQKLRKDLGDQNPEEKLCSELKEHKYFTNKMIDITRYLNLTYKDYEFMWQEIDGVWSMRVVRPKSAGKTDITDHLSYL